MAVLAGGAVRRPSRLRFWRQWLTAYLFITPWLIFPLVFIAGAIVLAFYFSLTNYDLLSDPVFVGLANYKKAMSDESFLHALRNVATYTAVVVPSQTFIGLVMAAIRNQKLPWRRSCSSSARPCRTSLDPSTRRPTSTGRARFASSSRSRSRSCARPSSWWSCSEPSAASSSSTR